MSSKKELYLGDNLINSADTEISGKEKFFETVISGNKDFNRLDQRDKAFVKLVVLGTLRRNGQIQKVIQKLIKTPLKKRNLFILNLIKISICQILFLGIKEYSVVNFLLNIHIFCQVDYFSDKY